ncbi:carboxymuconolactone decarboxylase family protein [Psychroflexus aestuariivivens]|uniref:carboxymuconolactone decarboxylase family protein n=1 Tax=Psychroflexus aestuariivivens TaxID=1795040 RepID=UPI000FDB5EE3|nr:carboxymuconolactone decarboxylase family protein [Psychroflexus aestuariivivens]
MNIQDQNVETVEELAKNILENTKNKMGMIPNMFKKMANNPSLLDAYTKADQTFRENSGFTTQEQEIILLSAAIENACHYCVAAHSFLAKNQSDVSDDIINAIRAEEKLPDSKLNALSEFTKSVVKERGYPSQETSDKLFEVGYTEKHVAGVITGVGMKTMSNYINHISEPEVDDMFAEFKWEK